MLHSIFVILHGTYDYPSEVSQFHITNKKEAIHLTEKYKSEGKNYLIIEGNPLDSLVEEDPKLISLATINELVKNIELLSDKQFNDDNFNVTVRTSNTIRHQRTFGRHDVVIKELETILNELKESNLTLY